MKKQSDSKILKLISSILNVRAWFDWERMKAFTQYLTHGFQQLFIPKVSADAESFKQATTKLKLDDSSLLMKQKALYRLSMIMLVLAGCVLGYSGYQMLYGSFKAAIVSIVVTLIALVLAFRYHFWYFQIKQQKLGCTFDEWFRQGFLGEKK
jgi:intracellular multiplication protein IcmV